MTVKALLKYENKNEKFTHESFYFILVEFFFEETLLM